MIVFVYRKVAQNIATGVNIGVNIFNILRTLDTMFLTGVIHKTLIYSLNNAIERKSVQ
jgi:hypothetical protein